MEWRAWGNGREGGRGVLATASSERRGASRSDAANADNCDSRGYGWGWGLSVAVVATLLTLTALRVVGGAGIPAAEAVQPYAPRGIVAEPIASGDWFALAVRASGFRPNSTVIVDVAGLTQQTMLADAAGVVDVRVELPDRIGVQVRGIALEGGGLELSQNVMLVRPTVATRSTWLLLLAVLLAVAGAVLVPPSVIRARLGIASRSKS
jgi:hypothetical protein